MIEDYRNTPYCPKLHDLKQKKAEVRDQIAKDHPHASDMHTYISKNEEPYKQAFMNAYNYKCAYCGVSIAIIPKHSFEIDHVIYEKSKRFGGSKAKAGYIDNLVLACHNCNHLKGSLEYPDSMLPYVHPDSPQIAESYVRDEAYYIRVSAKMINNPVIVEFYNRLQLGSNLRRIDYLLMSMEGLKERIANNPQAYQMMQKSIDLLRKKRNVIG